MPRKTFLLNNCLDCHPLVLSSGSKSRFFYALPYLVFLSIGRLVVYPLTCQASAFMRFWSVGCLSVDMSSCLAFNRLVVFPLTCPPAALSIGCLSNRWHGLLLHSFDRLIFFTLTCPGILGYPTRWPTAVLRARALRGRTHQWRHRLGLSLSGTARFIILTFIYIIFLKKIIFSLLPFFPRLYFSPYIVPTIHIGGKYIFFPLSIRFCLN